MILLNFPSIASIRSYLESKQIRYDVCIRCVSSKLGDFRWYLTLKERPPIGYQLFTKIVHNRTKKTQRTKFISKNRVSDAWAYRMERLSCVFAGTDVKVVYEIL